jgi:UDP-glucose 4-epimerase
MTCLVTGGAGYIGSHIVASLKEHGYSLVVLDNLSSGVATRIPGVPMITCDLSDDSNVEQLTEFMHTHGVTSVIHTAALKSVPESVTNPLGYFKVNVGGTVNLLSAMQAAGVSNIVFSGTAAVYGMAKGTVTEDAPTLPINPYGETKLFSEQLLRDMNEVGQVRAASLRYFNVAGSGDDSRADNFATNLIPQVLRRIVAGEQPQIFGLDYDTEDGSCVRDYIHVVDLAEAHILTLKAIEAAGDAWNFTTYNIGTGTGYSVIEVVNRALAATGTDLTYSVAERRPGDPARIVANPAKINGELGWNAKYTLDDMVDSAWSGMQALTK